VERNFYLIINILDYLSLIIVVITLISLIFIIVFEKGRNILFGEKARKIRYILGSLFINLYLLGTIFTLISFVLYRTPRINDLIVKVIVTILTLFFFKDYKWNIIKFVKIVKVWIVNK
jgi:hypothetical protein